MTLSLLSVAFGGFLGAICRFLLSCYLNRRTSHLPWGTLTVNLVGSFLLGWMTGAHWGTNTLLLAGTGFMGSFTTFSTLHWELHGYGQEKRWGQFFLYLALTYTVGILLALVGFWAGNS
ncbi:fluoride efflux transporter FluC [Salinithrix halophila]|uniref:Fluoride-specific ion channel FluC n=1 Tax=Salinithrix halophila TaxID=1485204 RepID=A0ABV8JKH5_9BACL